MKHIQEIIDQYKQRAQALRQEHPNDLNNKLMDIENTMVAVSGLSETDRVEVRVNMEEYRKQMLDGYEAGAGRSRTEGPSGAPEA